LLIREVVYVAVESNEHLLNATIERLRAIGLRLSDHDNGDDLMREKERKRRRMIRMSKGMMTIENKTLLEFQPIRIECNGNENGYNSAGSITVRVYLLVADFTEEDTIKTIHSIFDEKEKTNDSDLPQVNIDLIMGCCLVDLVSPSQVLFPYQIAVYFV
jgi:hypothetical protein